ncbi:MAG: hypothetical protein EXS31_02875 [Pedosphaera sp.]|nr:hypothetical protein [Pedosphaera sp.]
MKNDLALKIQACVDNELNASEAREVACLVESDAEARALHDELIAIRDLTVANEPEYKLPESGEFYWSKIKRDINSSSARPVRESSKAPFWSAIWTRMVATCGVAVGIALLISVNRQGIVGPQVHEIESALDEMSTITFHSDSANMTVVWVQNADFN